MVSGFSVLWCHNHRMKSRTNANDESPRTDIDSSFLKTLVGYNTRRATLRIMDVFSERMDTLGLTQVEFSVLSLIGRNPGVMPSQLCAELGLLAPNLTKILLRLDKQELLKRKVLATDKRAVAMSLSATGSKLLQEAESRVVELELKASSALTSKQRETLISLLQKIYN